MESLIYIYLIDGHSKTTLYEIGYEWALGDRDQYRDGRSKEGVFV